MTDAVTERRFDVAFLPALQLLTFSTGVVDAVSYLALDRVFTGNMTGNVLFIGFALAGTGTTPLLNNVVALVGFLIGALVCARIVRGRVHASRLPTANLAVLLGSAALALALGIVWLAVSTLEGVLLLAVTGLLAIVMGAQAASVRATGITDVTTIVVTSTLANLAIDSRLAGGTGDKWRRRLGAVLAMGLGGAGGALLVRFTGGASALVVAALLMLVAVALLHVARRREEAALG
ncbi:MAG: YoaK family protein [Leifsonia flava]